jgi:hypothetical protein
MHRTGLSRARLAAVGCALIVGALAGAEPAGAATAQWACSASTTIATVAGKTPLDPITTSRAPCAQQDVGLPKLADALGLAPGVTAQTAYAVTNALPAGTRPLDQTVGAAAGVEGLALAGADATVVIGVDAARSAASGSCAGGLPVLGGTSQVTGLTINGQSVTADQRLTDLTDALSGSPLSAIVTVKLNEQIKTATGLVQNAVHIRVLSAAGAAPLAEVVVAQSAVSSADACNPGTTGSGGASSPPVCPPGSILDVQRAVCIIPATQTSGQGEIVVGKPYQGPSGGHVVALNLARKRYRSPCLYGSGPKYVVIGTKGRDHITGTNHGDRILGLAGNDSLDGGRGGDCIDGGRGSDAVTGGIAPDRLYGHSGRDALNGGSGSDRMWGGTGNDSLNAAFGRDRVNAGPGNDLVNIATAGPPARANCGTGFDKVRINHNERRRTQACEVRFMLPD